MKRRFLATFLSCLALLFGALGLSACNTTSNVQNNSAHQNGGNEQSSPDEEVEIPVVVGTEGLLYEKIKGKDEYAFTGFGSITDGDIVIASHINGLPVTTVENHYSFYYRSAMTITIPYTVTTIADSAFHMCQGLTSIVIPDSVTSIGYNAFPLSLSLQYNEKDNGSYLGNENNPYLYLARVLSGEITSFTIDERCKFVGDRAFRGCASLTSIVIPDSVTSIGNGAFCWCDSLTSIVIPDSVTSIGDYVFEDCTNLTNIAIPDSVTSIGYDVFSGCSSLQYNIKDTGKYLGNENNPYLCLIEPTSTDITSCTIDGNCRVIGDRAFWGCESLTSVTIGNGVTSIGNGVFCWCDSLTSIVIPDSVTSIGNYAFKCASLTSIQFNGTMAQWESISKGDDWIDDYYTPATEVVCADGTVVL